MMLRSLPDRDANDNPYGAPPFNLEAEAALLGALMLRNDLLDEVGKLLPGHFYGSMHRAIYQAICDIRKAGRTATSVEIAKLFEKVEPVNGMTGPLYVLSLVREVTSLNSTREYARIIISASVRRELMVIGQDVIAAAREAHADYEPAELIEETEERLFSLAESATSDAGQVFEFGSAAASAFADFNAAREGRLRALTTGLSDLDRMLGGFYDGNLIVLGGRPSMGKTALATSIAHNVAKSGAFVDFYSLEMTAQELANRVIAAEADVSSKVLRSGKLNHELIPKVERAVQSLQKLAMKIDQTGGITISALAARARRNKRRHNTRLIVVDYLQLMQSSRRRNSGNRVEDVSEITNGLKAIAKELNVPVLALSQLSRNVEHRDNKRPQLSDLRESGSIEQDADVVMFVYRDEYYVERERPSDDGPAFTAWQKRLREVANKAEIIIGKQRHGETGVVSVHFEPSKTQFANLARQEAHNDRA